MQFRTASMNLQWSKLDRASCALRNLRFAHRSSQTIRSNLINLNLIWRANLLICCIVSQNASFSYSEFLITSTIRLLLVLILHCRFCIGGARSLLLFMFWALRTNILKLQECLIHSDWLGHSSHLNQLLLQVFSVRLQALDFTLQWHNEIFHAFARSAFWFCRSLWHLQVPVLSQIIIQ